VLINNGCKAVELIVDYFSFSSLLTNVPMAIYDTEKLPGEEINICLATKDNNFIGFNDKQYQIATNDIVVSANNKILSLAGILGNKEYGVDDKTKNITIEIANFSFINIRQTSSRLNINTAAAKSNSREISPYFIDLTTTLIYNILSNYEISNVVGDVNLPSPTTIEIDAKFISSIIGMNITNQHLEQFLTRFGFVIKNEICYVPLHRIDIKNNQDLAEELLKLININDITAAPIIANVENDQTNIEYKLISKISN
jgi:phenylalanyl-tRNA synthetase beta chain